MTAQGLGDTVERIRVGEGLEQALLNAMFHGNLEITERELAAARAQLDDQPLQDLVADRCRDPRRDPVIAGMDMVSNLVLNRGFYDLFK